MKSDEKQKRDHWWYVAVVGVIGCIVFMIIVGAIVIAWSR
jgi:hypothetical protein